MRGRLAIPFLGNEGNVYGLRFRNISQENFGPKYMGLAGEQTRIFNVRALHSATDFICITEGELDSVTLEQCGYPSVGVCGANNWKRHHPRMFAGFQRVYVFGDGDEPGRNFAGTVNASLLSAQRVTMPEGKDVNSLYLEQGAEGIRSLLEEDR